MAQGGKRAGAGRPKGKGKYGEPSERLRIPVSLKGGLLRYIEHKGFQLPVYAMKVPMGQAEPSIGDIDYHLDLNELIQHPANTFFHPVKGDSMEPTVTAGDLAMIDSALEAMHGDVVLAYIDGSLTLKRLQRQHGKIWLQSDNPKYPPITLNAESENMVCGVMLVSIRPVSLNHVRKF
jgi:DNA polymerase V